MHWAFIVYLTFYGPSLNVETLRIYLQFPNNAFHAEEFLVLLKTTAKSLNRVKRNFRTNKNYIIAKLYSSVVYRYKVSTDIIKF